MAGALATIAANLSPGEWLKTTSAEENGTSFDKWIRKYERWESIACGHLNHTISQRWNLLLATGGSDLEDIILYQAKIITKHQPRVDPVQDRQEIPHVPPNADGQNGQEYAAAIEPVIGRPEINPTPWDEGITLIRNTITKYSNHVMARKKLWFDMPAGNYSDWRKWAQELLLQAERCNWKDCNAEQAALDAMLYQCPNQQWKDKLMEGNLTFQEAIDYGMTKLTAKEEGKLLGNSGVKSDSPVLPVDKLEKEAKIVDCGNCFEKHKSRNCPAWSHQCSKCHKPNHLAGTRNCKPSQQPPAGAEHRSGGGGWNNRGRGNRRDQGRGGYDRRGSYDRRDDRRDDRRYNDRRDDRRDDRGIGTPKMVYVPTRGGGLRKTAVHYFEEESRGDDRRDDRDYDDGYDYPLDRVVEIHLNRIRTVGNVRKSEDHVEVKITPEGSEYQTKVNWTPDSGAPKTMLADKHFGWIMAKNSDVAIRRTNVRFRPYSTGKIVPLLGVVQMWLTNGANKSIKTDVYIVEGEHESLLGKQDAIDLGIIKMNPRGDPPTMNTDRLQTVTPEVLRCITPELLEDPIKSGIVLGVQDQNQIDAAMQKIAEDNKQVFEGMGRADTEPIHIQIRDDAEPVRQGRRQIPHQLKEAAQEKLRYMLENDLIEGPLLPEECKGWIHNLVVTKKSWDSKEVRINVDMKRMNDYIVKTSVPIPTTKELRHDLEGSDRFSALDCWDSFFYFLLDRQSQDLFKFHGVDGIYRFKVLVMGTPPASGKCHAAMANILQELRGVIVIKDDILVHGVGQEHDESLRACLKRLYERGIRLRREKCKLGQQAVMWFGHIYSKQGMSPDPAKVEHIRAWPAPTSKDEVKSFLQTVQFVAQFIGQGVVGEASGVRLQKGGRDQKQKMSWPIPVTSDPTTTNLLMLSHFIYRC